MQVFVDIDLLFLRETEQAEWGPSPAARNDLRSPQTQNPYCHAKLYDI
jgi:hypothetical protein